MKLIIGLGNPGKQYANNRHNIGFMVLERIVSKLQTNGRSSVQSNKWRTRVGANVFEFVHKDEKYLLVEPQKFMNNSGQVVKDLLKYYNLATKDILVIADDLNLEFGTVRIRQSGSDGGHNGLKDIINQIGPDFTRLKIGIKNQYLTDTNQWSDFVLANFSADEAQKLPKILDKTHDLVLSLLSELSISEETIKIF